MIYQDALRFLKQHIKSVTATYQWTEIDNVDFFNALYKRYEHKEIKEGMADIKEAFKDIFQSVGKLIFKYDSQRGIQFKVLPYSVDPKQSQHLPNLVKIIHLYREQIEHAYSDKDEQLIIQGEARRRISAEISESEEPVNKKELVKEAIRTALQLNPKDIVLIFRRKYIVKLYKARAKQAQKSAPIFSEADLAVDYKDFFEEVDHDTFLDVIIDAVTSNALDFDYMDNGYYEQYALKEIREVIIQELTQHLEDESAFMKAFAGYILKRDLIALHERIARALLLKISEKSVSAQKFIEYYTGGTVLVDGTKYKIPGLETPDGGKLNMLTVTSVAAAWLTAYQNKEELALSLHNISTLLHKEMQKFNALKEQFETAKKAPGKSQEELLTLQKSCRDQEENVTDINEKRQKTKQQIHKLHQKLVANEKNFKIILNALTKALMKRKKAL
jgi:uncharacterized Zn finger protein